MEQSVMVSDIVCLDGICCMHCMLYALHAVCTACLSKAEHNNLTGQCKVVSDHFAVPWSFPLA